MGVGFLLEVMKMFQNWLWWGLHIFVNILKPIELFTLWLNFIVCECYLKKLFLKIEGLLSRNTHKTPKNQPEIGNHSKGSMSEESQGHVIRFPYVVIIGGLVAKSCLTLATAWTVACQVPLSMGFTRRDYWSGSPFPSPVVVIIRAVQIIQQQDVVLYPLLVGMRKPNGMEDATCWQM